MVPPSQEQYEIVTTGADAWNKWRERNPDIAISLAGVPLSGMDLEGVNFTEADLRQADFGGANLAKSHFDSANLSGANLNGADLFLSTLRAANLTNAYVSGTQFTHTRLDGAIFTNAKMGGTVFATVDLSKVRGLDCVRHDGPSSIGLDTIYKSTGIIPESFLRGCGVSESFITQMNSLIGAEDGIQFYSCFISYSSKDEEFARRLHGRMRDAHLRVWFAPEDIQAGKKMHEQIETAIRVYDKLLIVLSEESLQSEWVMDELRKGFKAERGSGKRKLFPVRLTDYKTLQNWVCRDSITGRDLAEEVRQYFIPDFSNWKDHDQFETAFARLLKDLRAEERAK
jgi:hypothetical protein